MGYRISSIARKSFFNFIKIAFRKIDYFFFTYVFINNRIFSYFSYFFKALNFYAIF